MNRRPVKTMLLVLVVCIVLPFATGCKKNVIIPTLEVSADTLIFNDNERYDIYLSTESAAECTYTIGSIPDWIYVSPASGNFSNGHAKRISVTSDITFLESGTTVEHMIVKSNIGDRIITLIARKDYPAQFSLPDTLTFPDGVDTKTLTFKNTDDKSLDYCILKSSYYISTYPSEGRLMPGEQVEIKVNIERDYLNGDENLHFLINGQSYFVTIILENLSYSIDEELFVGPDTESATLNISNTGNIGFAYSVEAATNHITLPSNTSGSLAPYQGTDITVSIDKEAILADHTEPSLNVTIDGTVVNVPIVFEKKQMLSKDIIDAEYSKAKDMIVFIASDLTLNIYDAATKTTDEVTLPYVPTCVSISPDGTKAVVGHDAHLTYINLETKQILTENDISCYASDVVLAPSGWAYAFPRTDQWEHIRCIDVTIQNSAEHLHTGYEIRGGTMAKLHPSGKYIYGISNNISPSDIEKYDIRSGTANYLYDSPYHGDYAMGGNLWFTEDGSRIISQCGTVFKSSEIEDLDIMYNGKITLESGSYYNKRIEFIDHLELSKSFYIIPQGEYYQDPNPPFLYIYNSDNLTLKSKKTLESYYVTDSYGEVTVYPAEPYFVFANSNGEEVYVLTKAVGSGLIHEWAIQEFHIGQ